MGESGSKRTAEVDEQKRQWKPEKSKGDARMRRRKTSGNLGWGDSTKGKNYKTKDDKDILKEMSWQGDYNGRGQPSCKCNFVHFYKKARPPCSLLQ